MKLISEKDLQARIHMIREQRVMLDADLAEIYGVSTRALNQAVKRNRRRFPSDFVFQLNKTEMKNWMSQFVTSKSSLKMGLRKPPYAFTEHGAIMAAHVLRSGRAIRMSVFVTRAFIKMRSLLGERQELAKQLAALERKLTQRLDIHEMAIVDVLRRVIQLLDPAPTPLLPTPRQRRIGFRSKK